MPCQSSSRAWQLGRENHSITGRYTHYVDAVLVAAADAVADRTARLMGDAGAGIPAVAVRDGN
jgi:F420-0:gamma-glutamyl ligase